jgi:hypothetical protein
MQGVSTMRKILMGLAALLVASILGAYLWSRAAQNRIVEAMDLALEETERLWASDFNRAAIFSAPAGEQEVALQAADTDAEEGGEAVSDEEQPAVDPSDATSYYHQAEGEMAEVRKQDRAAVRRWMESGESPGSDATLSEALDHGSRALAFVEKGLTQGRASPWDTPKHGAAIRMPDPETHRFLLGLFVLRAAQSQDAGRQDDAAADLLRALAYAQDLNRHAVVATRFQFAPLQAATTLRMQKLLASVPVGQGALDRTLKALTALDEIDPPASQTLQMERLAQVIGLGKAATTNAGPGRVPAWQGIFDFTSMHQLADATETTRTAFEKLEKAIDQPVTKASGELESVADQLRRSNNPIVSNLMPHPERLQVVVADAARQLRLAELAAAIQLYRLSEGDFPNQLGQLKGKVLKRLPTDPISGEAFQFRPPDEGRQAKLSAPGEEDRASAAELTLEATVPPASSPDTLPAGALRGP